MYEDRGLCIARKYQAKGYGKQVLGVLLDLVFENLNANRFIYSFFSTNENSKKVCLYYDFKYLEKGSVVRDYDNRQFEVDYYYLDKDMYEKQKIR